MGQYTCKSIGAGDGRGHSGKSIFSGCRVGHLGGALRGEAGCRDRLGSSCERSWQKHFPAYAWDPLKPSKHGQDLSRAVSHKVYKLSFRTSQASE